MILLDRNVPRSAARALQQVRDDVKWLEDLGLPSDTPDVVWLRMAGEQGWLVITRDQHIRRRPYERQVIEQARVGAFVSAQTQPPQPVGMAANPGVPPRPDAAAVRQHAPAVHLRDLQKPCVSPVAVIRTVRGAFRPCEFHSSSRPAGNPLPSGATAKAGRRLGRVRSRALPLNPVPAPPLLLPRCHPEDNRAPRAPGLWRQCLPRGVRHRRGPQPLRRVHDHRSVATRTTREQPPLPRPPVRHLQRPAGAHHL